MGNGKKKSLTLADNKTVGQENIKTVDFIANQRIKHKVQINKYLKEVEKFFNPAEFNLLIGLHSGLEYSLILEYVEYLENDKNETYILFDIWSMNKLIDIYQRVLVE